MKKLCVFLACFVLVGINLIQAQNVRITGTVTSSEDGMPIPGVSVVVKGTTTGGITNVDGKYDISVPAAAQTLIFSFVGMKTQEIAIGGKTVIDVALASETLAVEELVVTGYATRGKNSITGSTVQVKGESLKNIPVASVDQTLQGKVAGLTISSSSGTPGSIQDIRIRGRGSLTASNDPLFVIDGVPVQNSNFTGSTAFSSLSALSSLNNNDIETITVLKDASATSAYGARGSNGVIVITTKKGKTGKTNYNLSAYYGFTNKAVEGRKVLSGVQREELFSEAVFNTYGLANGFTEAQAYAWAQANLNPAYTAPLDEWIAAGRPVVDWEKAYRNQNAPTQNVTFTASGGNEESSFYASLGYNKNQSIIIDNSYRRINGVFNYTKKLNDKIKFSTSNNVSDVLQDGLILEQSAYYGNPILAKYFGNPWQTPLLADGTPNQNTGTVYNWLYIKDNNVSYNDMIRGISNSFVEYEFIKNLKFKSLVSLDYTMANYKSFANRNYGDGASTNGYGEESDDKNYNWVTQNSLSYNKTFGEHNISAMGLIEFQKNREKYIYAYGENFATDGLTNVGSAGANKDASVTFSDWMNASYLGMFNYSYGGKYIADVTYRREGSSKFAKGQRFGNFWSVGAAWNVTKEQFMSGIAGIVDNLRLRTSYGVSGNSGISANQYQSLLAYDANYADQGAVYPSGYGNNFLTWEKNNNFDVGIDFGILKNKISGQISYFDKVTSDLLYNVPLTPTSGFSGIYRNAGSVKNTGIEVLLNFDIMKSKDLNVNFSVNFATLKNEVTKLAKDGLGNNIVIESGTSKVDVGHPINEWYMRKWAGVDPTNGLPQWYINGKDDADGITNAYYSANLAFQGSSPIPKYSGGASFHVDFKGFYFDASAYIAGGNKVFEDWSRYVWHGGTYTVYSFNGAEALMNRWQQAGDVTDVPIVLFSGTANNASRTSTRFLFDGTFARLKDIVIGYNFPKPLLSKIGFNGDVNVFARGTNLFTWVKDKNMKYDPEVRADGFTRLTSPPTKTITFGLTLNF
jgi:TonB-linked SusC/RagA family outer membrane protein